MAGKETGATIRVWVPGCASGEEAISLAILLAEARERLGKTVTIQIFATDIDSGAIARARQAEYRKASPRMSPRSASSSFHPKGQCL